MKKKQGIKAMIVLLAIVVCIGVGFGVYKLVNRNQEVLIVEESEEVDSSEITGSNNFSEKEELQRNRYLLNIDTKEKGVEIGDMMYGLFFEDINFAADGGIYAELIKNRSFEYTKELAANGALHGYKVYKDCSLEVLDTAPMNENNTHYLQMINQSGEMAGFTNAGFLEGIALKEAESYRFTVYLRSDSLNKGITVKLLDKKDKEIAAGKIDGVTKDWVKYSVELKANSSILNGKLLLVMDGNGTLDVDMVSLFPLNTYKNRENGLRADLVEMLAKLEPSFIRFPGGCIVEGDPLTTAYRWKDTIGDVSERKQNTNLWIGTKEHPYYQSYGLGFYEYFLLCEDLEAKPVPILNAGMSCQARSGNQSNVLTSDEELQTYIQDALDLIEFSNGDASTKWGAVRAEMGHPEPFDLEYLGIGNEQWEGIYFNRYIKFVEAIRAKYPDIKLITTSGPSASGNFFDFAWNTISAHKKDEVKFADLVDEHYYNSPDWFLSNTKRYDTYERDFVDVFLGEYAAKSNTLYAAVAEAAYMTGLERNADVVKMASYAPLLGNLISKQWTPDMIYFNNSMAFGSINYYVQKMFSNNRGDYTLNSDLNVLQAELSTISGKVGVGTWLTSAVYDDIKVVDNETGKTLYENDFSNVVDWKSTLEGNWDLFKEEGNSVYGQNNASVPTNNALMGSASYVGENNWSNYTYTIRAKKLNGSEGFIIPFAVKDHNNFYHWNLGGWANTQTCVEQAQSGSKSIVSDTKNIPIKTNQWYEIKIEVNVDNVKCYLDGKLIHTIQINQVYPVYETVSKDEETGDMIIKLVNAGEVADVTINLNNTEGIEETASLELLTGARMSIENTVLKKENVVPVSSSIKVSESFVYSAPAYSVSIIRIASE